MKRSLFVVICLLALIPLGAMISSAQTKTSQIARGKYLVEQVGMCIDCHTPRNEKGELVKEKWLQGSTIEFKPIHPMPWSEVAPGIAGLPGWKEADFIKLMTTGVTAEGQPLRPPMPPYRMNDADARAVAAYLKSLKSK